MVKREKGVEKRSRRREITYGKVTKAKDGWVMVYTGFFPTGYVFLGL